MEFKSRKDGIVWLIGDLIILSLSLWLTLFLRTGNLPSQSNWLDHLGPFLPIFIVWVVVFFIFDLYRRPTFIMGRRMTGSLLTAQLVNTVIAIIFFYFIPYFGITPKTTLFIYLLVSFGLLWLWRRLSNRFLARRRREKLLFLCAGSEVAEIKTELETNPAYNLEVLTGTGPDDLKKSGASAVVIDPDDRNLNQATVAEFYHLLFEHVRFVNVNDLYEALFDRVPVSLIKERWFLDHIGSHTQTAFDLFKRGMDIGLGLVAGIISLVFYPFVYLAIKLDDGGPIFTYQKRVGQSGRLVNLVKFRTMTANDQGQWVEGNTNRVTSVGRFLRLTRIDELPQLWNVVNGDVSLVGPRPEFPEPVKIYEKEIPYYSARHLVKPGLSGWAQLYGEHPHHGTDVSTTKNKLSYDLYYIKNRGLWLDITIALRTIRTLLSFQGK